MRLTTALGREDTNRDYRYQTTCSILTPANNAALKALAIAEGGTTVVPEIFSGEFWHFCGQKCKRWFVQRGKSNGRSYGAIKRGFAIIFSLCFDKLNMTEDAVG